MNRSVTPPLLPASNPASPGCSGCTAADPERRLALQRLGLGAVALCGGLGRPGSAAAEGVAPQAGDLLSAVDADPVKPLTATELAVDAKQVLVWPVDPATMKPRDGSRLNRILLIRLDPGAMDADTKARAADGVLAYSAVCSHQGCDVSAWRAAEKTLLCFCHFSQFQPAEGAAVVAGPAPRSLPFLPLRLDGARLVLAGGFSEPPGAG